MNIDTQQLITTVIVGILAALPGLLAYRNQRRITTADVAGKYEVIASKQADEIDELRCRIRDLEKLVQDRDKEITEQSTRINNLIGFEKINAEKLAKLEADNAQLRVELATARTTIERLTAELRTEREVNRVQIRELRERVDELEAENHRLEKKEAELERLRLEYNALRSGGGYIPPKKDMTND